MESLWKKVAIVGVAEGDCGEVPNKTAVQIAAEASIAAIADAGLQKEDIDAVFTTGTGAMPSVYLSEYLQLRPKYTDSTMLGGSSFVVHVEHAAAAIAAGLCEAALIAYGSTQLSDRKRGQARPEPWQPVSQWETPFGQTVISNYALVAQRHMYEFGTTHEQLGDIAIATRAWATMNPKATMREPLTREAVAQAPIFATPLRLLDCCLFSDGGGALVVTSAEKAAKLNKTPVYVLGCAEGHTHQSLWMMPRLTNSGAVASGERAFKMSGLTHKDIDVAEIYDSFTITVLQTLEDLGFCPKGAGGKFVEGGRTGPGGDFPMNTQGGGLSFCHPGMFGIFTVIEAVRQLRGECGDRQVKGARHAICHGNGGTFSTQGTLILGRE